APQAPRVARRGDRRAALPPPHGGARQEALHGGGPLPRALRPLPGAGGLRLLQDARAAGAPRGEEPEAEGGAGAGRREARRGREQEEGQGPRPREEGEGGDEEGTRRR